MTTPVIPAAAARLPDRGSALPLWAQVSADLRRRCAAGAFTEGVPGEHALCEEYGVSRHTIREALRALRAEGVIASSRGRGSVVQARFTQSVGAVYSLFRSVEAQGAVQSSEVLRLATTADPTAAARLGLAPDALLVVLERIRRADGEVLAHDTSWLPHTLAHPLLAGDFSHTALYDELLAVGVDVDGGAEQLTAVVADAGLAALLDVEQGSAVLHIERCATSGGRPVEWRVTDVRGDRFAVATEWTTSGLTLSGTSTPPTESRHA